MALQPDTNESLTRTAKETGQARDLDIRQREGVRVGMTAWTANIPP